MFEKVGGLQTQAAAVLFILTTASSFFPYLICRSMQRHPNLHEAADPKLVHVLILVLTEHLTATRS